MLNIDYRSPPAPGALTVTLLAQAEEFAAVVPGLTDTPAAQLAAPTKPGAHFFSLHEGRPHLVFLLGASRPVDAAVRRLPQALARALSRVQHFGGATLDASRVAKALTPAGLEDLLVNLATAASGYGAHRADAPLVALPIAVSGASVDSARVAALIEAHEVCRSLVQRDSSDLSPEAFAQTARALVGQWGATATVLEEAELRAQGFGGLIAVGKGSGAHQPPRLIHCTKTTDAGAPTLVLVGKGITFDSGGYSIKSSEGMMLMKKDMAGAAAVLATFGALVRRGVRANLHAILCCAENMVSPTAVRPGDVYTTYAGKTVEVLNTDAEGRLVLADGLAYAMTLAPDLLVDVATLTGACRVALGKRIAGCFTRDPALAAALVAAGRASGDRVWPLPLPQDYAEVLREGIADLRNIGKGRFGGAITAALFLAEFVHPDVAWVHLDTYGWDDDAPQNGQPSAFGVRLLERFAVDRFGTAPS